MKYIITLIASVFATLVPAGLAAQELAGPAQEFDAEIKQAQERGQQMFDYDQAAWHATDSLLESFDLEKNSRFMRGYIVLPRADGLLDTVFYGDFGEGLVEAARYTVDGAKVVNGDVFLEADRAALDEFSLLLINAREVALEEATRQEYGMCSDVPPNTIVLPPNTQGVISVYVLTPQTELGSYPIGGHYRIDVGPGMQVISSRRFLNTCFDFQFGGEEGQDKDAYLVLSHLLDPQPTEIHAFASYYSPVSLVLATTENRLLWLVEHGRISYFDELDGLEE